MISHMAMVFAAEGIKGPEKLLLLAYTNRTDDYGFCWPSEKRLADDCGTSVRTVARAKANLTKMKLIRSVRRKDRHTGEPIANLTRVNLPLLASMARSIKSYDDNLIAQITFDDDDDAPGVDPSTPTETGSDLLTCQDDRYLMPSCQVPPANLTGTSCQDGSQSISYPSGNPLSPRGRARVGDTGAVAPPVEERETMASPTDKPTTQLPSQRAEGVDQLERVPGAFQPAPQPFQAPVPAAAPRPTPQMPQEAPQTPPTATDAAARVVDAYAAALGRPVLASTRGRMRQQAAELLAADYPETWLADRAREMAPKGWTDLARHVERSTVPIPGATPAKAAARPTLPEWWECADCGKPAKGTPPAGGVCRDCREAAEQAALPPHCGHLDCDEITRQRDVEDANGFRVNIRCPECHPSAVAQV